MASPARSNPISAFLRYFSVKSAEHEHEVRKEAVASNAMDAAVERHAEQEERLREALAEFAEAMRTAGHGQ